MIIKWSRILIVGFILLLVFLAIRFRVLDLISLSAVQSYLSTIHHFYVKFPALVIIVFILFYIFSNLLPIPLMLMLTLFGGAVFGPYLAVPIVLIASTAAALISALLSRFILRHHLENYYQEGLKTINNGLQTNGIGFLLSLRLIPLFPFFVVNFLLGLTRVPFYLLAITTFVGLIPAVSIYAMAGKHFSTIHSINDVLSPKLVLLLIVFSIFSFLPTLVGRLRKK